MDTQTVESKFSELSGALNQKFGNLNLTQDELRKAMASPDGLVALVSQKTGIPKDEASRKVHEVMSDLHIDDEMAKGFMAKVADKVESKFGQIKDKFTHH